MFDESMTFPLSPLACEISVKDAMKFALCVHAPSLISATPWPLL